MLFRRWREKRRQQAKELAAKQAEAARRKKLEAMEVEIAAFDIEVCDPVTDITHKAMVVLTVHSDGRVTAAEKRFYGKNRDINWAYVAAKSKPDIRARAFYRAFAQLQQWLDDESLDWPDDLREKLQTGSSNVIRLITATFDEHSTEPQEMAAIEKIRETYTASHKSKGTQTA